MVLTNFLLNRKVMDISSHTTQVRDWLEVGWDSRVYMEDNYTIPLEVADVKNSKQKLKQPCKGGGWLTFLPRSQYGTDLSRDYFVFALWWRLGLLLQYHPLICNGCSYLLMVEHV